MFNHSLNRNLSSTFYMLKYLQSEVFIHTFVEFASGNLLYYFRQNKFITDINLFQPTSNQFYGSILNTLKGLPNGVQ